MGTFRLEFFDELAMEPLGSSNKNYYKTFENLYKVVVGLRLFGHMQDGHLNIEILIYSRCEHNHVLFRTWNVSVAD